MAERRRTPPGPPGAASRARRESSEELIGRLQNRRAAAQSLRRNWKRKYRVEELYTEFYGEVSAAIQASSMDIVLSEDDSMNVNGSGPRSRACFRLYSSKIPPLRFAPVPIAQLQSK